MWEVVDSRVGSEESVLCFQYEALAGSHGGWAPVYLIWKEKGGGQTTSIPPDLASALSFEMELQMPITSISFFSSLAWMALKAEERLQK